MKTEPVIYKRVTPHKRVKATKVASDSIKRIKAMKPLSTEGQDDHTSQQG